MANINEFAAVIGAAHGSANHAGSSITRSIAEAEDLAGAFRALSADG